MSAMVLAFLFGLVGGDPAALVERHYVRIASQSDVPDMNAMRPLPRSGRLAYPYSEASYGWRPGKGNVRGEGVVERVRRRLGSPLRFDWFEDERIGYIWRHRANAGRGMLLVINEQAGSVHLLGWSEHDKAQTGRIGMEAENEIYRWFDWLTTPEEE